MMIGRPLNRRVDREHDRATTPPLTIEFHTNDTKPHDNSHDDLCTVAIYRFGPVAIARGTGLEAKVHDTHLICA